MIFEKVPKRFGYQFLLPNKSPLKNVISSRNMYDRIYTLANLCALAGSKSTSIALKLDLRLMKGEQSKDCQKST